jgi:peptidoglycan/LPS O-acetylase OafA/YrhL
MQSPPAAQRRPELPALTGLRVFAAAHVVLLHSFRVQWLPAPLRAAVDAAHTSTSLLFVLSGFILVWTYAGADGRLRVPFRVFLVARVARLYPLLLASQLLALPLWLYAAGDRASAGAVAVGLLGVQGWVPAHAHVLNAPGWAASFLFLAYALFPALLAGVRRLPQGALLPAAAGAWVVAMVPGALALGLGGLGDEGRRALFSFPVLRLPEFVFGMLAAVWLIARGPLSPRTAGWAAAGALAVWGAALLAADSVPLELFHNGMLAPVHGVLILALACGGGAAGRFLAAPALRRLGKAGLAVFLLHLPLLGYVEVAGWLPLPSLAASAAVYAGYLAATGLLSVWAMDHVVDPVAGWAKARWARPSAPPPAAPELRPELSVPALTRV